MLTNFAEIREAYAGAPMIALDLETTGLSAWNSGIAVIGMYEPISGLPSLLHYPRGSVVPQEVLRWLESFDEIITHNGTQFDILFLAQAGMDWTKVKWYDTLIGEQAVIAVGRRDVRVNLQDTIKRRLGKAINKNIDHRSWGNETLTQEQLDYVAGDIVHLYDLRRAQEDKAAKDHTGQMRKALDFEMSLIPAVLAMELNGLPVDFAALETYIENAEDVKTVVGAKIQDFFRENIPDLKKDVLLSSPKQVKEALGTIFGERLWPDTKAERFMEYRKLHGPIAGISELFSEYRHADQRKKMFSQKWIDDYLVYHSDGIPRVHGKFWQIGTETGRFSSSQPNLQQIPRDGRALFGNAKGMKIGKSDYAAIEVRVAAAIADDRAMIEAFNNGEDIHRAVAAASFGIAPEAVTHEQRRIAKSISFTFLFGGGLDTFLAYASSNGSTIDRDTAQSAMERFFETYEGIKRMKDYAEYRCATGQALPIVYPTGLKRMLVGADLRASVLLNNVVQGTAAAGLKMALKLMHERDIIQYGAAVVHDEFVYVAPDDEIEEVRTAVDQCMLEGMQLALSDCSPIAIAVESTWADTWKGNDENERLTTAPPVHG